jgi:hypothetical protein
VRLEGLGELKKSTPSELEPATFWPARKADNLTAICEQIV